MISDEILDRLASLNERVCAVLGCGIHGIFPMNGGEGVMCPVAQYSADN
jgi:hypothetical protein